MNILYTCDNNYIWIMGISMISLFKNNKNAKQLNVYLLGEKISDENKKVLNEIATKYKRNVYVIDVPKLDIPEVIVSQRWPLSAFTRLFSGQLLPEKLERILYLDCDTIVTGDISGIDGIDISDSTFAGVKDCIGKSYKENIGLEGNCYYINAGVIYINLQNLRKKNVKRLIEQYLNKYLNYINYADQDILNGVFHKDISILNHTYDVMTIAAVYTYKQICTLRHPTNYYNKAEFDVAVKQPLIIHYTTNMRTIRPWYKNTNHPFKHEFAKYKSLSPWADVPLNDFKFTTKESKIIGAIQCLPTGMSNWILGMIHAELKPRVVKMYANKARR